MRPSLLFIGQTAPWPPDSGGRIRAYHLLSALAQNFDVTLIAGADPTIVDEAASELDRICRSCVLVPDDGPRPTARSFLRSLVTGRPTFVEHNYRGALERAVRQRIADLDPHFVYLDHLDTTAYWDLFPERPVVLDTHNILHEYYARRAASASSLPLRLGYALEARRLSRYEARCFDRARLLLVCSERERSLAEKLAPGARVSTVPNGVDCDYFHPSEDVNRDGPRDIVFVGDMAYEPNWRGAIRFIEAVLPTILGRFPDARFVVVGRNPSPQLEEVAAREAAVVLTGSVPDVRPFVWRSRVFAIPLEFGSGTRLKLTSAFAMGVPVVSTRLGAEGVECTHREHLLLSETIEAMGDEIIRLLDEPKLGERMAHSARALAEHRYDWSVVGQGLIEEMASLSSHLAADTRNRGPAS